MVFAACDGHGSNRQSNSARPPSLVRDDRHEPGGERAAGRVEPRAVPPGPDERLLDDIVLPLGGPEARGKPGHGGHVGSDRVGELSGSGRPLGDRGSELVGQVAHPHSHTLLTRQSTVRLGVERSRRLGGC